MKNLRLRAARAAKGLSQQALADLVGASRQTINAIEQGDYNPTINLCIAICRALDRTLDDLFWEGEQGGGRKRPEAASLRPSFYQTFRVRFAARYSVCRRSFASTASNSPLSGHASSTVSPVLGWMNRNPTAWRHWPASPGTGFFAP